MSTFSLVGEPERILYRSDAFQAKLFAALGIIGTALKRSRRPYIAFSGGIDSTAVMVLCEMVRPGIPVCWSDDELEVPETVAYMTFMQRVAGPQFQAFTGGATHAGWFTPWSGEPYWRLPLAGTIRARSSEWHIDHNYDLVILGTRMEENRRRRDWMVQSGPIYGGSTITRRCCPVWDWSRDDVWALIAGQNIPYHTAYNRMEALGIPRKRQRVGPFPLVPRDFMDQLWPELLPHLIARYGNHW